MRSLLIFGLLIAGLTNAYSAEIPAPPSGKWCEGHPPAKPRDTSDGLQRILLEEMTKQLERSQQGKFGNRTPTPSFPRFNKDDGSEFESKMPIHSFRIHPGSSEHYGGRDSEERPLDLRPSLRQIRKAKNDPPPLEPYPQGCNCYTADKWGRPVPAKKQECIETKSMCVAKSQSVQAASCSESCKLEVKSVLVPAGGSCFGSGACGTRKMETYILDVESCQKCDMGRWKKTGDDYELEITSRCNPTTKGFIQVECMNDPKGGKEVEGQSGGYFKPSKAAGGKSGEDCQAYDCDYIVTHNNFNECKEIKGGFNMGGYEHVRSWDPEQGGF